MSGRRGWGLLATLVGMRVTVALGSRLRGNDGGGGAGMTRGRRGNGGSGRRGWGLLATLVGMRVTVALGSRLRGNDGGRWYAAVFSGNGTGTLSGWV